VLVSLACMRKPLKGTCCTWLTSSTTTPTPGPTPGLDTYIHTIDISQHRLLFVFSLLNTDRVPFELLHSAALLRRESCGGGGQIVFLNLPTII
jgi:hypothetical protein